MKADYFILQIFYISKIPNQLQIFSAFLGREITILKNSEILEENWYLKTKLAFLPRKILKFSQRMEKNGRLLAVVAVVSFLAEE